MSTPTPDSRLQLRAYIRFQLAQLSAQNGAHAFEKLVFDLARARLVINLLPATGPVQSGGDQGRDFESYHTYLANSPLASASFTSLVTDGLVVGACTLNRQIIPKIKDDLRAIFGSGEKPVRVIYFCEVDVPVSKRHEVQEYCRDNFKASLDIFDGQAIAEMLSDRDTSWFADRYLQIPSEMWPVSNLDGDYLVARERWLGGDHAPGNLADFIEIKNGVRTATFDDEARRDLGRWIDTIKLFLNGQFPLTLKQRTRYEIAVVELRGRKSLDPAMELVANFFADVSSSRPAPELLDAAVLANYVFGSRYYGESAVTSDQAASWLEKTDAAIEEALEKDPTPGHRFILHEAQAMTALLPRLARAELDDRLQYFFSTWQAVLDDVAANPLAPIRSIADIFAEVSDLIEPCEQLSLINAQIDGFVAERSGKETAAKRARQRAMKYLQSGYKIAAINDLHLAKEEWFTGENVVGSILAMLLLSSAYDDLGLSFAARYYAAGALFTAIHVDSDRTSPYIVDGSFAIAQTFFSAGEGVSFIYSLGVALSSHYSLSTDPHDWTKHQGLQNLFAQAVTLRAIALRLFPTVLSELDAAVDSLPLPVEERHSFRSMSERGWLADTPLADIEKMIEQELGNCPFRDVGTETTITWSAFGMLWKIRSNPNRNSICAAAEVATALQILQVEFADVDLLSIPSAVEIDVVVDATEVPLMVQFPDNGKLRWNVTMPEKDSEADLARYRAAFVAFLLTVLGQISALPSAKLEPLIHAKLDRGFHRRVFSVRPIRELMDLALPNEVPSDQLAKVVVPSSRHLLRPFQASELRWKDSLGPGYSRELAEAHLQSRYLTTRRGLAITLPRIANDQNCRRVLLRLRSEGLLDWQLLNALLSLVAQWQVEKQLGRPMSASAYDSRVLERRIFREEESSDPEFDLSFLTKSRLVVQLKIGLPAVFKTWGLEVHRETPDFEAMKEFLDVRYRHSADDIPHDDPLRRRPVSLLPDLIYL